jgi:hypothetical protein
LSKKPVPVEKLFFEKSARITSRQDALQAILSTRLYISGHRFLRGFRRRPTFSTATPVLASYNSAADGLLSRQSTQLT